MGQINLVRPARLELATNWFEASYSNPLSYGRSSETNHIITDTKRVYYHL